MKVFCPAFNKPAGTGKGFFAHRLCAALSNMGVVFIRNPNTPHDIDLAISFNNKPAGGRKYILRLDGLYYESKTDRRNKPIAKSFVRADGIIYQSKFSSKLVRRYLSYIGARNKAPFVVIHNGADPAYYGNIEPIPKKHKYQVLAVAKWRPHKRLAGIIKTVLKTQMDVGLWVIGDTSKPVKHPNIQYLGKLDQKTLSRYYKGSDVSIHLCPYDNCPNTVVESIAAGTPVLCSSSGGTPELVSKGGGIVCNAEEPFNCKPVNQYKDKPVSISRLSKTLRRMLLNPVVPDCNSIDIRDTATSYYKFFESVLML